MGRINWKLRQLIIEKFDSQFRFAQATGDREPVVSRAVRGALDLSETKKAKWAQALGVSEEDIFPKGAK